MREKSTSQRAVRLSPIAGSWYPGTAPQLEATVAGLIARAARPTLPGSVRALIAPHAGYPYSGGVAAHAYAQIEGATYETVVILGPDHRGATQFYGIADCDYYQTPLGQVAVDQELVQALSRLVALERIRHDTEHSLEIQLPFLQHTLHDFTLLPIMMGYPLAPRFGAEGWQSCQMLSEALTQVLRARDRVLLVASTDLSHLYSYRDVVRYDGVFMELLKAFNPQRLAEALMAGECHACGGGPVVTGMMTATALGADTVSVLTYANSGDVTGDKRPGNYIVGYLAAAITASDATQNR